VFLYDSNFFSSTTSAYLLRTGLKYEDLLVENDDLEKALNRIPKSVKVQR
jgi:hypothetical protein